MHVCTHDVSMYNGQPYSHLCACGIGTHHHETALTNLLNSSKSGEDA